MSDRCFDPGRLESFASSVFVALGVLEEHAEVTARRLVEADLRGRSGHGLMRVPSYVERVRAGGINLRPDIRLVRETPVSALVDGDNGLGQVVMTRAAEVAIAKAEQAGLAWVGTRMSNHAGAGGVYTAMALRQGLAALYFAVAAGNTMPPWGGREALLGTNPIAVAIPAGEEVPFQLDIATTVASHGSIRVKAQEGDPLPEGWVADPEGNPITDPDRVREGFLLPIGGYKGSGLNIMIGLLAGVMNGAAFGRDVVAHDDVARPTNTGQAILVLRPDLFMDRQELETGMDRVLRELRSSRSVSGGPVRLPGEQAAELEVERARSGIPLPGPLLTRLRELAAELQLPDQLD